MSDKTAGKPVKAAVITGGHCYDVPNFHALWRSIPQVESDVQHMDDFASSPDDVRDAYDVVVFYIMLGARPTDDDLPWYAGEPKTALEHLGEAEQGVFVLHHAILAYPEWPVWSELVGIEDRTFGYHPGESLRIDVADSAHPITRGLKPWQVVDETYKMSEPAEGSQILLTTDHPKSMHAIGWTRQHGKSRVFCFQSGHDNVTWAEACFRQVLRGGIQWCARRI